MGARGEARIRLTTRGYGIGLLAETHFQEKR